MSGPSTLSTDKLTNASTAPEHAEQILLRCFTRKQPPHYDHVPALEEGEHDVAEIPQAYQGTWPAKTAVLGSTRR